MRESFFQRKAFHRGQTFSDKFVEEEGWFLHVGLIIKSMSNWEWEGSFIKDKYLFQQSEYCKPENFPKPWWDI